MSKKILFTLVFILFLFSCKKETEIVDLYLDYFPVKVGTWVIYDVDSISVNDFTLSTDTFYFQVKEVIESDFLDNEGRLTQRIERYYRDSLDSLWTLKNVWTANRLEKTAERVEDNIRYVKLIFPIAKNAKWDGNNANIYDELRYEYKDIHTPYALNSNTFDSCLTILQQQELTIFTDKFAEEVYANHIGKIYRKHTNFVKQADGIIISDFNYSYKAIAWGIN